MISPSTVSLASEKRFTSLQKKKRSSLKMKMLLMAPFSSILSGNSYRSSKSNAASGESHNDKEESSKEATEKAPTTIYDNNKAKIEINRERRNSIPSIATIATVAPKIVKNLPIEEAITTSKAQKRRSSTDLPEYWKTRMAQGREKNKASMSNRTGTDSPSYDHHDPSNQESMLPTLVGGLVVAALITMDMWGSL